MRRGDEEAYIVNALRIDQVETASLALIIKAADKGADAKGTNGGVHRVGVHKQRQALGQRRHRHGHVERFSMRQGLVASPGRQCPDVRQVARASLCMHDADYVAVIPSRRTSQRSRCDD